MWIMWSKCLKQRSKDKDEDVKLVERAKANDKKAFEEIVNKYQQRVFDLCYWMLFCEFNSEDAAQETFIRAYKGIKKFREDAAFYTWLYRIAINVCKDIIKKKERSMEKVFSEIEKEMEVKTEDTLSIEEILLDQKAVDAQDALRKKELREIMQRCIARLSEQRRALIDLIYFKGLKYKEASFILNLPEGTVKSNLVRSLQMLKKCLEPYLQKGEI